MSDVSLHVSDVGTGIVRTIIDEDGNVVDCSTATIKTITFKKPDGTVIVKDATLVSSGVDGKIRYVTVAGFLDQPGTWLTQGFVTRPDGSWHSDIQQMPVEDNL